MSVNHQHDSNNLKLAFILNFCFTIFEIIGGIYTNSISIISDAVHDLGDSLSLGLAWYLDEKSKKEVDAKYSFGYKRLSLVGALINSVVLIIGSGFVLVEAFNRIINPEPSDADGMIVFALIGVAVNGYAAWKVQSGKTMNEKVISWHLMEDVLGWVAVLIVAIILKFKHIAYLDPLLSICITLYILWGVSSRLKEIMHFFLQGVPSSIDIRQIEQEITSLIGVESTHHTHVWSLDGEHHVFTTHVKLKEIKDIDELVSIKNQVYKLIEKHDFYHHTIQIELSKENCTLS